MYHCARIGWWTWGEVEWTVLTLIPAAAALCPFSVEHSEVLFGCTEVYAGREWRKFVALDTNIVPTAFCGVVRCKIEGMTGVEDIVIVIERCRRRMHVCGRRLA